MADALLALSTPRSGSNSDTVKTVPAMASTALESAKIAVPMSVSASKSSPTHASTVVLEQAHRKHRRRMREFMDELLGLVSRTTGASGSGAGHSLQGSATMPPSAVEVLDMAISRLRECQHRISSMQQTLRMRGGGALLEAAASASKEKSSSGSSVTSSGSKKRKRVPGTLRGLYEDISPLDTNVYKDMFGILSADQEFLSSMKEAALARSSSATSSSGTSHHSKRSKHRQSKARALSGSSPSDGSTTSNGNSETNQHDRSSNSSDQNSSPSQVSDRSSSGSTGNDNSSNNSVASMQSHTISALKSAAMAATASADRVEQVRQIMLQLLNTPGALNSHALTAAAALAASNGALAGFPRPVPALGQFPWPPPASAANLSSSNLPIFIQSPPASGGDSVSPPAGSNTPVPPEHFLAPAPITLVYPWLAAAAAAQPAIAFNPAAAWLTQAAAAASAPSVYGRTMPFGPLPTAFPGTLPNGLSGTLAGMAGLGIPGLLPPGTNLSALTAAQLLPFATMFASATASNSSSAGVQPMDLAMAMSKAPDSHHSAFARTHRTDACMP